MRRTILLALVAALLVVPNAFAAGTTTEILRDCTDDGILQGTYTAAQLRTARDNIPAELNEYSDCKDVLSRAISQKAAASSAGGGGGSGSSGSSSTGGGSNSSAGTGNATPDATTTPAPTATPRPAIPPGPPTTDDTNAIAQALSGPQPVEVTGHAVSPGETRLAASIGRNSLPSSMFVVFGLLAVSALIALGMPLIRRRVLARQKP